VSELDGVSDAVDFIAKLRQSSDYSSLKVGRRVVVIGGGMTAIDAAIQARMLGAEDVMIAYRRSQQQMNASVYEQQLAQTHAGIELEYTVENESGLAGTGESFTENADHVLMAIGQAFDADAAQSFGLTMSNRRIKVDDNRKTSHNKVWAGGDCIDGGCARWKACGRVNSSGT